MVSSNMYLYFESFRQTHVDDEENKHIFERMDQKKRPHEGMLVKVYAMQKDPRLEFGNHHLPLYSIEADHFSPSEKITSGDRTWTGVKMEWYIAGYSEAVKIYIRALCRFSASYDFTQDGLSTIIGDKPLISHPMHAIHGWTHVPKAPTNLHLDIFLPQSMQMLKQIMDINDQRIFVDHRAGTTWRVNNRFG